MKTITKYKANDGTEWNDEASALKRDNLVAQVDAVMAPLGTVPKRVTDGEGWLQHDPEVVIAAKQGILDLCKPDFAKAFPQFNEPAEKVHPLSIIGRILDDAPDDPRSRAWNRFCRIDPQGREHQQCYFAYTDGPAADHVCIEDRRVCDTI